MANTRSANVWAIDTTGAISETLIIKSIKLVAGSDSTTFTIKKGGSGGTIVYTSTTTTEKEDQDLNIRIPAGSTPYVTITGTSPKAYLYLK